MANKERKLLFTGARARILFDGTRIGWASGCSFRRAYSKQGVEVVDNIEVEEFATLGYQVSGRASKFGLVTESLTTLGLLPAIGNTSEEHIKNLLAMNPFTWQLIDTISGKPTFEFHDCEVEAEDINIAARSIMMHDISIVGIRVKDADEL